MTLLQALVLGIVQGLTEFLPISSSGHLVLVPYFLGWHLDPTAAFVFDVLVQWGTLLAVVVYFWDDLWGILRAWLEALLGRRSWQEPYALLGWYLILATIPGVVIGLLASDAVERAFGAPRMVGALLLITAFLLWGADRWGRRQRSFAQLDARDALIMGFFQVLALFPGISRSGATLSGGMLAGLERPAAARFSFLMSVPIMIGAGAFALGDLLRTPEAWSAFPALVSGFFTAAVSGYLAIRWLLRYLVQHDLRVFVWYCTLLGLLTLLWR